MKPKKIELGFTVEVGGYWISGVARVSIGDLGIGSYEFWGHKGVDSHYGIDDFEILSAEFEDEPHPTMTAKELLELDYEEWLEEALTEEGL